MGRLITLFEHEAERVTLNRYELRALHRLNRVQKPEALRVIPLGDGSCELQATQYAGVIRVGGCTIQVLPKIYWSAEKSDKASRAKEATRNLLYMLELAAGISVREHESAPLLQRELDWFEVLTRIFTKHLTQEWQRGPVRGYVRIEDNLPVLKGKWLLDEQLRYPARRHIFSLAYDEFTADNQLNRLFRYVVERLWRLTTDAQNRQNLGILRQWMDEITLLPRMTSQDASNVIVNRLHRRYEPLVNLAKLFLEDSTLQLAAGDLDTFSLVFDMNQLFEGFVVGLIKRYRQSILPESWQSYTLHPQSRGAIQHLAIRNHRKVFQLRPDLAFRARDGWFPLLLDTKYKILDNNEAKIGISQGDMYQMYAYARRYNSPRVLLVYPQTADMNERVKASFDLEENGNKIIACTVNLCRDITKREGFKELRCELQRIIAQEAQ